MVKHTPKDINVDLLSSPNFLCFRKLGAGLGQIDVGILDPHGHKDVVKPTVVKRTEETWYVEYTPKEEGMHSINIFFAGKAIPNSPYGVGVSPGEFG